MAYGLRRRLPDQAEALPKAVTWRSLDGATRLRLVERQLAPAGEAIDGFPLAL